jgi:hypothetical protein
MGLLDGLRSVLGGDVTRTLPIELAPGETEQLRVVASKHPGGASVGGGLVLTDRRLVFTPLNVHGAVEALTWGLGKAGAPEVVAKIPATLGGLVGAPTATDLDAIAAVERGNDASVFKPPTIVVTGHNGVRTEIGVLRSRGAFNGRRDNNEERDRMLDAIHATRPPRRT